MSNLLMGIDLGTTFLKAAVFDDKGTAVAEAGYKLRVITGADGRREQNIGEMKRALLGGMEILRKQCGTRWRDVAGMGLAAQGGSTCICLLYTSPSPRDS